MPNAVLREIGGLAGSVRGWGEWTGYWGPQGAWEDWGACRVHRRGWGEIRGPQGAGVGGWGGWRAVVGLKSLSDPTNPHHNPPVLPLMLLNHPQTAPVDNFTRVHWSQEPS